MSGRRDEKLSESQMRELLQRSAGLCEFENCAQPLFFDLVSGRACNDGQYAHIIPSSENGPRGGGGESPACVSGVDNRMHLCHKHHEIVDNQADEYPAHLLRDMKRKHEDQVAAFGLMLKKTPVMPIVFCANIKGRQTDVDYSDIRRAVRDDARPLLRDRPDEIRVESSAKYGSDRYWEETLKRVNTKVEVLLDEFCAGGVGPVEYGIFPLAPIPLIMYFGWRIGDKLPLRVYQLLRDESRWSWNRKRPDNSFSHRQIRPGKSGSKRISIALSLSAGIGEAVGRCAYSDTAVYELVAARLGVDCISKQRDLYRLRDAYYLMMDEIQKCHGANVEVYLYPAIPVSAAFEIGCRYMPAVFPHFHVMENMGRGGWSEACVIGG